MIWIRSAWCVVSLGIVFLASHSAVVLAQACANCVNPSAANYKSGCGSLSVASSVKAGDKVTVSVSIGCGPAAVSLSRALPTVIVDGQTVTAQAGTANLYNYLVNQPSPSSGVFVANLSNGSHTLVFTIDPKASSECVRQSGNYLVGPWAVLGGGYPGSLSGWSTPAPFVIGDQLTPPSLAPSAQTSPKQIDPKASFTLTLTVTNGGQKAASNLKPPTTVTATGTGKVQQVSGPTPASLSTLAGGATTTFTYQFTGTDPGKVTLSAQVTGTDECNASVTPATATVDIKIGIIKVTKIEPVQAVFGVTPLVADKKTLVRATFNSTYTTQRSAKIRTKVIGAAIDVLETVAIDPGDSMVMLPAGSELRLKGNDRIYVNVDDDGEGLPEPEYREWKTDVEVVSISPLRVLFKRVAAVGLCGLNLKASPSNDKEVTALLTKTEQFLDAIFPAPFQYRLDAAELSVANSFPGDPPGLLRSCPDQIAELERRLGREAKQTGWDRIGAIFPYEDNSSPRIRQFNTFYDLPNDSSLSGTVGEAGEGGKGYGFTISPVSQAGENADAIVAHELGHTFGLALSSKRYFLTVEEYQQPNEGVPTTGEGYWVAGRKSIAAGSVLNFMGLKKSFLAPDGSIQTWIGDDNLQYLTTRFLQSKDPEAFLVSGTISAAGNVTPDPWYVILTKDTSLSEKNATHAITLVDSANRVLGQVGFTPTFVPARDPIPAGAGALAQAGFLVTIPTVAGTAKVQVRQGQQVLFERAVSSRPQVSTIASPAGGQVLAAGSNATVTWTGTDPDGDSLWFSVMFSPDNGARWLMLGQDLKASTLAWTVPDIGTTAALIKVRASDGVNSGERVSSRFSVVGTSAATLFASGGPDQDVRLGTLVTLDGTGSQDPQGRTLTYTWRTVGAPSAAALSSVSAARPTFTPTAAGAYVFGLIVNNGVQSSAEALVTVNAVPPTVTLTPSSLNFGVVNNGAGTLLAATPAQTIVLTLSDPGTVTWTASASQPWMTLNPASGTGTANIGVSINNTANTLPTFGALTGTITIATTGAANSPTASVNLTVLLNGTNTTASGVVETPAPGQTGISGSIAVTGWAIDDVGVTQVRLLRDPVIGETPGAQVFIGTAALVTGARPDVAAAYPAYPLKDQAGWGYLLLTNYLPAQGNGTFTLYAYADDVEGGTTLLGARTITVNNLAATTPFGSIDTPAQGGTASGASFVNFGWALTPNPKTIPADGSTIRVFIDSVPIGTVTYNNARSDIQTLFPGYANTNGAIGFRVLDTTALANGVHTIAWVVTDDQGAASGIGSRFFSVSNSALMADPGIAGGPGRAGPPAGVIDARSGLAGAAAMLASVDQSDRGVAVRRGFDPGARPAITGPDRDGVRRIRIAQLERVAIDLDPHDGLAATYRGYSREGEALRALPVGSHLDRRTGEFAWAPGLAFGGTRELIFVRESNGRDEQIRVEVAIEARSAPAGEPRLVIDLPGPGATVPQPFTIAGWAFDPNGPAGGPGIDTLHVWAYPIDDGLRASGSGPRPDPVWIGVAGYGGSRPDVAALFGHRFITSGFTIEVAGLPAGTYDLVVYAHSEATGDFTIARTVRVTVK